MLLHYVLLFALGLAIGCLPSLRRLLDSFRWAALSWWSVRQGITTSEMDEDEMLPILEAYSPTSHAPRLRRAK